MTTLHHSSCVLKPSPTTLWSQTVTLSCRLLANEIIQKSSHVHMKFFPTEHIQGARLAEKFNDSTIAPRVRGQSSCSQEEMNFAFITTWSAFIIDTLKSLAIWKPFCCLAPFLWPCHLSRIIYYTAFYVQLNIIILYFNIWLWRFLIYTNLTICIFLLRWFYPICELVPYRGLFFAENWCGNFQVFKHLKFALIAVKA